MESTWVPCFFFFPSTPLVFFFSTPWTLKQQAQRQKKETELRQEDHVSSKVGFLKFCYLLFLANNYETVILNIETIFCKTVLLPLLVELELELETKSPFGAETETNIWDLEQHLTWVLGVLEVHCTGALTANVHVVCIFFSFSFSFLLLVYII